MTTHPASPVRQGTSPSTEPAIVLRASGLGVDYRAGRGRRVAVLRDIDLELRAGESLALVGESGCGKTTLALALLRLLPKLGVVSAGSIRFRGTDGKDVDLLELSGERLRRFRWAEASIVYQGGMNALNPLLRIRAQFADTIRAHRNASASEVDERARELLSLVRLDPTRVLDAYPHELSGGMRQRVMIALALVLKPRVLVLDEPTTALDILTQRSIVKTIRNVQAQLGFALLFVTHDLGLAAELADRVMTLYAGRVAEIGDVEQVFYGPRHPYTIALINAVPAVLGAPRPLTSITGGPPGFGRLPDGCPFHPRCPYAQDACRDSRPSLQPIDGEAGHAAGCLFANDLPTVQEAAVADG